MYVYECMFVGISCINVYYCMYACIYCFVFVSVYCKIVCFLGNKMQKHSVKIFVFRFDLYRKFFVVNFEKGGVSWTICLGTMHSTKKYLNWKKILIRFEFAVSRATC